MEDNYGFIDRVTMTGPDESVDPSKMVEVSNKYPFVEWAILVSGKYTTGQPIPRFPGLEWIKAMFAAYEKAAVQPKFSMHICGSWVRDLLANNFVLPIADILPKFDRIQINTHAQKTEINIPEFIRNLHDLEAGMKPDGDKQFIIQWEWVNGEHLLKAARLYLFSAVPLYDCSHGAGILPVRWPIRLRSENPQFPMYCGYAGGIGPDNIRVVLPTLADMIRRYGGNYCPIWIDMETKIRSDNDQKFDLDKVVEVLDACKDSIKVDTYPM